MIICDQKTLIVMDLVPHQGNVAGSWNQSQHNVNGQVDRLAVLEFLHNLNRRFSMKLMRAAIMPSPWIHTCQERGSEWRKKRQNSLQSAFNAFR